MKCKNCNEIIEGNFVICPHCNTLNFEENQASNIYICPVCGSENYEDDTKCIYCCSIFINK